MNLAGQETPAARAADEQTIRKLLAIYVETWNRHDMEAWGKLFTDDVDFVNRGGGWWRSNNENVQGHKAIHDMLVRQKQKMNYKSAVASFWIPAHVAFEVSLIAALVATWSQDSIRFWLLLGLTSHAVMRVWSAFDFIPKALAFERTDAGEISETAARHWTRRSLLRLPLDLITCGATLVGFAAAVRVT